MNVPLHGATYQELIMALVLRRYALKMSQYDLAPRMGTSQGVLSEMESGKRQCRSDTLHRWANALDCTLSYGLIPHTPPRT